MPSQRLEVMQGWTQAHLSLSSPRDATEDLNKEILCEVPLEGDCRRLRWLQKPGSPSHGELGPRSPPSRPELGFVTC